MKRILFLLSSILLIFVSCANDSTPLDSTIERENAAVVYFSATGNTKRIAQYIAAMLEIDIYEIEPKEPYTSQDLNWNDNNSRASQEHNNYPNSRPEIANDIDLSSYDTIFLGYPIWWGDAPSILITFCSKADLSEKTVIPFATSSSSPLGDSAENLKNNSGASGNWIEGRRFRSSDSEESVRSWLGSI